VFIEGRIDGTTYHTTQNYYSPDWWDQMVKEKFKEETLDIFQNGQTSGFLCSPDIVSCKYGAGYPWSLSDYSK